MKEHALRAPFDIRDRAPSEEAPPDGRVGAFFDMDRTVLRASSGRLYLEYIRKEGQLSLRQWTAIVARVVLYISGVIDFPRLMAWLCTRVTGQNEADAWALSERWFDDVLRHYIAPAAVKQIEWHRSQGHHVAIVSAATPFAVQPVAKALGLGDAFLATQLESRDGLLTGAIVEPACYGIGKVLLAHDYCQRHGLTLANSYFYSDSHEDLPLLEAVGYPVAVNPDRRLERIARQRAWPIQVFYGRGQRG